jgi:hypothetical protein
MQNHFNSNQNREEYLSSNTGKISPEPTQEILFHAVRQQQEFENLHCRFTSKDFISKNRFWHQASLITSYLINSISITAAFYGVFTTLRYFGAGQEISSILAAILLILIEIGRRKAADSIWDEWFKMKSIAAGFLTLNIILFLISTTSSGFGIYQGIHNVTPVPTNLQDTILIKLEHQAELIQGNIDASKKTTWKGKITRESQKAITQYSSIQENLLTEINKRIAKKLNKEENIKQSHREKIKIAAVIAICIYLILEVFFQACMSFISYYDYRKYLLLIQTGQYSILSNQLQTVNIDPATINTLIHGSKTGMFYPLNIVSPNFKNSMSSTISTTPSNENRLNENRNLSNKIGNERICEHCHEAYIYNHAKQKYCSDKCRMKAWEERTGKKLNIKKT